MSRVGLNMGTEAFGSAVMHLLPTLGPALMIGTGYVDLGKWVAAVEGGARFGFDLVLLVLLFNFTAILCQYLAARIGMVSGKNLAEICSEEYCMLACVLLGVQAELSMIISDLTTILGMAHGLSLLSGMDIFTCVFFVTAAAVLLPLFVKLLGHLKAASLYIGMAGLALLLYVLGVLISQPEIPLVMNGIFPKLSGENVYSLMALLGANIMAHNFYIHSSLVQEQSRSRNVTIGALFHDHLFAILFIFTGIFLVNYVLIDSAAAVFSSVDVVLNFQDISLLIDQIFRRPIAPAAFFLVLFLSSQTTTLTWNIGGELILHHLFGAHLSTWSHHLFFKTLTILSALYCVKSAGVEGIYQLLIFCQVILAMFLPSSVIPLFRVASSKAVMGNFKVSWHLEILALLAFLGMFAANIIFAMEMLFGNSSWIMNLRGGMGSSVMVPYAVLLLISFTSFGLTLYLAVTPLKSASDVPDSQTWTWSSLKDQPQLREVREEEDVDLIKYDDDQESAVESPLDKSMETQSDKSILEYNPDLSAAAVDCDYNAHQSAYLSNLSLASTSQPCQLEPKYEGEVESSVDSSLDQNTVSIIALLDQGTVPADASLDQGAVSADASLDQGAVSADASLASLDQGAVSADASLASLDQGAVSADASLDRGAVSAGASSDQGTVSADALSDQKPLQRIELKNLAEKGVVTQDSDPLDKDIEEQVALTPEESVSGASNASAYEGPGSSKNSKGKVSEGANGSGSLSKLSGLGRAARRQLSSILDEFWGTLFDFHGKLTQEASTKRLDVVLGLDLKIVGSGKADITNESSVSFYTDSNRGQDFPVNLMEYSPKQKKVQSVESSLGAQLGSPSWSQAMQMNSHLQNSCSNLLEPNESPYSNYRQLHSDNHDYQPATIHGYQLASYLKGIGAGRNPYSSTTSHSFLQNPNSATSFLPNLRDQIMYNHRANELGPSGTSGLQTPAMSRINRFQAERAFYEPSFLETGESIASSASTKKYHSSPDISAIIAATRNSLMNEGKWGGPIGPQQSLGRMAYEQSQYSSNVHRTGVPLAFDELSPPRLNREVFSLQSGMNIAPKSLWSRQPFEQLFGVTSKDHSEADGGIVQRASIARAESSYEDSEAKLLLSFRFCIMKLLKLDGSDWLFRQNGGSDEELIDQIALAERFLIDVDASQRNQLHASEAQHLSSDRRFSSAQISVDTDVPSFHSFPNCGDSCVWRANLVISFGVWCIRRVLELALVESRPELWGKYTYVLNRLQGVIEPAFFKTRRSPAPCNCLQIQARNIKSLNPSPQNGSLFDAEKSCKNSITTAGMVLDIIKDVEAAVSSRKGRTGTAAGDVAFPKGKENLASVLKRYKRRLLNKFPGTQEGNSSSRKIPAPAPSTVL